MAASGRPPLRIALFTDWYLPRHGGIELHLADLARRLGEAGHLVDVLTTMPAPPLADHEGVRVLRLDVPRLPVAGIACTPALLRAVARALDAGAADRRPYDVAHAHASVVAPVAWAAVHAARRRGVPCVVTAHSVLHASARAFGLVDALVGWTRGPVLVTGVSAVVADALRVRLPRARVAVLPNATDVDWWQAPGAEDARELAVAGVPPRAPGEVRLVTAMRLTHKKRPLVLVDALAAAMRAAPPGVRVRLVAAGDGPLRDAVEAAARTRGLGDALVLPGWLPRLAIRALYHAADAFVLPTASESFGIAALEARAAGLPVIGRAGTGLAEFVTADGAAPDSAPDGVLAADDRALAAAAARLVADPGWRAGLAAASAGRPPRDLDWATAVARHEAAYRVAADPTAPADLGAVLAERAPAGRPRVRPSVARVGAGQHGSARSARRP